MPGARHPKTIFYSYSHEDEELRKKLNQHLKIMVRNGLISSWDDRQLVAGEEWDGAINEKVRSADIILLLISSSFMSSDYINDVELAIALERHAKKEARVIPVILRECFWKIAAFAKLQALPTNGVPVTSWKLIDDAFTDIAAGVYKIALL